MLVGCFDDLEVHFNALNRAVLRTVNLMQVPRGEMVYRFHDLPSHMWRAMSLGAHHCVALALTTAHLRSGQDLHLLRPRIPPMMITAKQEALARDFGATATHIVFETDNAELL